MMLPVKVIHVIASFAIILIGYTFLFPGVSLLIWNKTESAPKGLYLWQSKAVSTGDWAILKGSSATGKWIATHGYIGEGWPIVKRIVASEGDVICRDNLIVTVNGIAIAEALETDFYGNELPSWTGCLRLNETQVFLINDHPHSLDGRYFGAESLADLSGSARLIWAES